MAYRGLVERARHACARGRGSSLRVSDEPVATAQDGQGARRAGVISSGMRSWHWCDPAWRSRCHGRSGMRRSSCKCTVGSSIGDCDNRFCRQAAMRDHRSGNAVGHRRSRCKRRWPSRSSVDGGLGLGCQRRLSIFGRYPEPCRYRRDRFQSVRGGYIGATEGNPDAAGATGQGGFVCETRCRTLFEAHQQSAPGLGVGLSAYIGFDNQSRTIVQRFGDGGNAIRGT